MISSKRTTKAYEEGRQAAKNTLPYMSKGKILTQNPYYRDSAQGRAFSKGFSEFRNRFGKILSTVE